MPPGWPDRPVERLLRLVDGDDSFCSDTPGDKRVESNAAPDARRRNGNCE